MTYPSRTEIVQAMSNPVCYRTKELIGGELIRKGANIVKYAGGYTTVFPFIDVLGKKHAVRVWQADIGDAKKRSYAISEFLSNLQNPYFVNFQYIDNAILIKGSLQPIIVMEWVEGKTLKKYINENANYNTIIQLAESFKVMVAELHRMNIAHGDLQHGNIMVKSNGDLALVDYDSMYIEQLKGMYDIINGLPGYQHPARSENQYVNSKLDYFSELVIYLSLLIFSENPQLWHDYYDTEDLLFSKEDFANIKGSKIYKNYCNSSNETICNLMQNLVESLEKPNIDELFPLEDLLVDKKQQDRRNKWNKQPNQQKNQNRQQHQQTNQQFIVNQPVHIQQQLSVKISQSNLILEVNKNRTLTAEVSPKNAVSKSLVWSSSDTNVATVNNGVVTALKEGTAVITVESAVNNNISAYCIVKVDPKPKPTTQNKICPKCHSIGCENNGIFVNYSQNDNFCSNCTKVKLGNDYNIIVSYIGKKCPICKTIGYEQDNNFVKYSQDDYFCAFCTKSKLIN